MARIPKYTQDRLASSLTPVVVDNSAAQLSEQIGQNAGQLAQANMQLAAQKQREVDAHLAKVQGINDTLTAYEKSITLESKLYDIINEQKKANVNNPSIAVKEIERQGSALIASEMANISDLDIGVKEKMAGIVTNSFRGKISELHSWQLAQDTANAQGKIETTLNSLYTMASKSTDINDVANWLDFDSQITPDGSTFGEAIQVAYGTKALDKIQEAKENIAKAYCIGMLDRKSPNQVGATLDSGAFDSILNPEDKHAIKKMADTMIKSEKSAARRDNMFEIYSIKENATIQSSTGEYTPSQALADKKRIAELGGKPTDLMYLTNKSIKSENEYSKENFEVNKKKAHDVVTKEWARISGKKGNLKADTEIEDIIKFQSLVEKNRDYFSTEQYDNYMYKLSKSRVKRVQGMSKNWLGQPQGELRGDDEYSKGYSSIYDYCQRNFKDGTKKTDAINGMVGDFVKLAEQEEAKTGKSLTHQQAQNILKTVRNRQAQKINPYLKNIPESGQVFIDKNGKKIKRYPDGREERLN